MTGHLAEFDSVDALKQGSRRARADGFRPRDALTPFPLADMDEVVPPIRPRLRVPMALAGFSTAGAMFALEWWSATSAYPFNEGGRPFFSWQVFGLVPFEVGVLAAGLSGMVAFCIQCGLPRLHHPLFDVTGIERASQDRFFLLFDHPGDEALPRLYGALLAGGALRVAEARA